MARRERLNADRTKQMGRTDDRGRDAARRVGGTAA
jgi:hypothetical protein